MQSIKEQLDAILAATPDPPMPETDPADIGDAAEVWIEEREQLIERLRNQLSEGYQATAEEKELLNQIHEKDSRWEAALVQARHEMFHRLKAVSRIRNASTDR